MCVTKTIPRRLDNEDTTMANPKKRQQLEDAYTSAHVRALTLLENLHEIVEDMPAPDNDEDPIDWGHVGSLEYLCERLREMKEHFSPASDRE